MKNFSTDSCLSYLNNKIVTGFESGLYTGMILIDLQKEFDTIDDEILLLIRWNFQDFLMMLFFGLNNIYQIEYLKLI